MSVIEIQNITKDYGKGRGVFDVSFAVERGEVVGFLGPNGAGKTTAIRQLMGFIRPDRGRAEVLGMDCFAQRDQVQARLGYLPGEIAFMEDMTGTAFIRFIAQMKGMGDLARARQLMEFLELDGRGRIRRMSKGMKQKIGLVIAFMQDPDVLVLDEPTSGLDPLMQGKFVQLISRAKKAGKTVLMSSHMFEEVEQTCDRVVIIKEGRVIAAEEMQHLRQSRTKVFLIDFATAAEAERFCAGGAGRQLDGCRVVLRTSGRADALIKELAGYTVTELATRTQSLEELFMHYYGRGSK